MNADNQGPDAGFPKEGRIPVDDFEEYTFRAPRPGFFAGDLPKNPLPCPQFELERIKKKAIQNSNADDSPRSRIFTLPVEILCAIFIQLDICSLLTLARLDFSPPDALHLLQILQDWHVFAKIAAFPKLLAVASALECRHWTIGTIFDVIQDERCVMCGYFGDILDLMTPERRCFRCFIHDDIIRMQSLESISKLQKCSEDSIEQPEEQRSTLLKMLEENIPVIRLIEGNYGGDGDGIARSRHQMFDMIALKTKFPTEFREPEDNWSVRSRLQYATSIRAPFYDMETLSYKEGYFCRACAAQGWTHRSPSSSRTYSMCVDEVHEKAPTWGLPYRRYSREGMKNHVNQYGGVFKIEWSIGEHRNWKMEDKEMRYIHGADFERWVCDEPRTLRLIWPLLVRLRNKQTELPEGATFVSKWYQVRDTNPVFNKEKW
ncbi:unnamed protein product [Periconia digitata]|uniref:F-box domain-containing protein n=1 Tax=Periconia digitata TaxID=1303443 RepID=A0A9W4UEP6_9PLEO|nr:unnamed protein product [Periconia digitata]